MSPPCPAYSDSAEREGSNVCPYYQCCWLEGAPLCGSRSGLLVTYMPISRHWTVGSQPQCSGAHRLPCLEGCLSPPSVCPLFCGVAGGPGQGQCEQGHTGIQTLCVPYPLPPHQPVALPGYLRASTRLVPPALRMVVCPLLWLPPHPTPREWVKASLFVSSQGPVGRCPACCWACRDEQAMTLVLQATMFFLHVSL